MVKAVTWAFCSKQQLLLETFASNLVSLTCPSLQILGKTRQDRFFFDFRICSQSDIVLDSGTSNAIDVKLGPVTKVYKRNMEASKKN